MICPCIICDKEFGFEKNLVSLYAIKNLVFRLCGTHVVAINITEGVRAKFAGSAGHMTRPANRNKCKVVHKH